MLPDVSLISVLHICTDNLVECKPKTFLRSGALDGATTKRTVSEKVKIFVYDYMSKTICYSDSNTHAFHSVKFSISDEIFRSLGSVNDPVYIYTHANIEWLAWRINMATQILYFLPRPYALLILYTRAHINYSTSNKEVL